MIHAQLTDVGRKRNHNEDNLGVTSFGIGHQGRGGEYFVGLVCDGMGGAAGGEVASALAVQALFQHLYQDLLRGHMDLEAEFVRPRKLLREALAHANTTVYDEASSRPGHSGMGCTATVMMACHGRLFFGQVGDSRGYLLRDGELAQITLDHSFVSELLRDGRLTPEEAENHPRKSVITRAIGSRPEVEPDVFELEVRPGDIYLVCSDGLSGMVPDPLMQEILSNLPPDADAKTLAGTCRLLIDRANDAGGTDNISVVLALAEDRDVPELLRDPIPYAPLPIDRVIPWDEAADEGFPDASFEEILARRRR